jgi:cell fate (sporulation/competence/biofilm development) regulator YmcA (YheA/YmcA/DUF963 family)
MSKLTETLELLTSDPNIIRYRQLEELINNDSVIKQHFAKLKNLQKQITNAKHFNKVNLVKSLEEQYQLVYIELSENGFFNEYLDLQSYCNEVLLQMRTILSENLG